MRETDCRIILVVGPFMSACHAAAIHHGLTPAVHAGNLRCVTKPYGLVGWSRNTPVITPPTEVWDRVSIGRELADVLDVGLRTGQFRIAQEADIAAIKGEMV